MRKSIATLVAVISVAAPTAASAHRAHPFTLAQASQASQSYVRGLWAGLIPAQRITTQKCGWISRREALCETQMPDSNVLSASTPTYAQFPLVVRKSYGRLRFIDPFAN